jgi:DNA replicative helicase MCM subunit Mcm2 (Cdc46/Mcm family)
MGISCMILGESGRGKSRSIKSLNPSETLVIKAINKPFPFKSADWKPITKENPTGSIFVTDNYDAIKRALLSAEKLGKKVIIIDDAQYLMANEFMNKSAVKGFDKFTEIAKNMWELITTANEKIPDDIRVYFLQHTETTTTGDIKAKTIGKMLDDKITIEGMVTVVLNADKENDKYFFTTQNSGSNTCKSPEEMFEDYRIDNDLKLVDDAICDYYGLTKQSEKI